MGSDTVAGITATVDGTLKVDGLPSADDFVDRVSVTNVVGVRAGVEGMFGDVVLGVVGAGAVVDVVLAVEDRVT